MTNTLEDHPTLDGIVLFMAAPGMHVHDDHSHDGFSIIVVTSGCKRFRNSGQSVEVTAGEIAIANPGEIHGCGPANGAPWSHKTWYVAKELAKELVATKEVPRLQTPSISDSSIASALNAAHDRVSSGTHRLDSETTALEALQNLFTTYTTNHSTTDSSTGSDVDARTRACVDVMSANLADRIELRDLASAVGVSRNQVIRDFKRIHNMTPGQFLKLLRLQHAKKSLESGEPLKAVAVEAGFADQSHFTRQFRRAFGVTPNALRKIIKPDSPF